MNIKNQLSKTKKELNSVPWVKVKVKDKKLRKSAKVREYEKYLSQAMDEWLKKNNDQFIEHQVNIMLGYDSALIIDHKLNVKCKKANEITQTAGCRG